MSQCGTVPSNNSGYAIQRRFPRYSVDCRVRVWTQDGKSHSLGRGHDLGMGGFALYVPLELKSEQTLVVELELPFSRRPLLLNAQIRNCNGFRYGMAFVDMPEQASAELERVLRLVAAQQIISPEKNPAVGA